MTDSELAAALATYGIHADRLELWGTGSPLREFLWSEDMADASVHVLLNVSFADVASGRNPIRNTHINVGTGIEHTIAQVAETVRRTVRFEGSIHWDASKPDGTMRKLCDVSRLHALGWHHTVELDNGIEKLYEWYLNDCSNRLCPH